MRDCNLERDGFCLLEAAVDGPTIERLAAACDDALQSGSPFASTMARRGQVYASRNLIDAVPEVTRFWQNGPLVACLRRELGDEFGLVRALFFDKPPQHSWNLPWHKDRSIAVQAHPHESAHFSLPTIKAGVPHLVASDQLLRNMLTLRVHLDDVTRENGPLRVIPGSHHSTDGTGSGPETAVTIFARAGDVLAMRPLISHASGMSDPETSRHRRIVHLEFSGQSELPDGVRWQHFISPTREVMATNQAIPNARRSFDNSR